MYVLAHPALKQESNAPYWCAQVMLCVVHLQVTDISTFTDDKKRAEVDAWLYETCTQCLQHIIDITVKFYPVVQPLIGRVLELLLNFIRSVPACMYHL